MNNINPTHQIVHGSNNQQAILGALSLALVVAASLVALWRGSFVSTLSADTNPMPETMSADIDQDSVGNATVILVPEQVSTIQGAIHQSTNGGVIFVSAGTYRENIRIQGKNISLQALAAGARLLGDGREGPIAIFENSQFLIDGFHIENARGEHGRGLVLQGSQGNISNCHIKNNVGGVAAINSKAQFERCEIAHNTSAVEGGGIWAWQSDVRLSNCKISKNITQTCGGGMCVFGGSVQLLNVAFTSNSVVSGAWGGGLYSDRGHVDMNTCVMQDNFSQDSGAAIYVLDACAKIRASTFKRNSFTGAATVVGAQAEFDIADSELETFGENMATTGVQEAVIAMADADQMTDMGLMAAAK